MKRMSDALRIDLNIVEERAQVFIKSVVKNTEAEGVVVGLSGGLDSAVTAALCVRALGKEKVFLLIMPDGEITSKDDVEDAINLAQKLEAPYTIIDIATIYRAYVRSNPMHREEDKVACGNLKSRIRMTLLYYYSNAYNFLVAGTGDKSEILIGYFTKWGDGAADFRPIEHLYKTQVRWLAKHLGLPEQIATKPSSPGLWRDQLAEEEIGIKYSLLDLILHRAVDLKMDKEEITDQLNIPVEVIEKVEMMVRRSEHKRKPPSAIHRTKNKKYQESN